MSKDGKVDKLIADLDAARQNIRDAAPGLLRVASADLDAEEVWTSMRLAGSTLERDAMDALVRRNVAIGGHPLEAYVRASDYARAARFVRESPSSSRRRGYLSVEEVVALHALATRRTSDRPGRLRETTLNQFPGGMVATPAWLIPQTLATFVERLHAGPPANAPVLVWIAEAHARYERIHPFPDANGRVGRLLMNLLLKRCGYVPFVYRARDAAAYLAALRAADSRDALPLGRLLATSLARSYAFLAAALPAHGDARPLSAFARGARRAALYKAAQRHRLRAFRSDGRLLTTAAWIAEYDAGARRA
jgi:Fic family protein